jgi:hypothetical protein
VLINIIVVYLLKILIMNITYNNVKPFYCYDETVQIAEETGDEIIKCIRQCEKCKL